MPIWITPQIKQIVDQQRAKVAGLTGAYGAEIQNKVIDNICFGGRAWEYYFYPIIHLP